MWWWIPAWVVLGAAAALVNAGEGVWSSDDTWYVLVQGVLMATGVLILVNRPGHAVGRFFFWAGLSYSAVYVLGVFLSALGHGSDALHTVLIAVSTLWVVLATWGMSYFPDGALPSRRWRWADGFFWLSAATAFLASVINGGWGGDNSRGGASPWHDAFVPWGDRLSDAFFLLSSIGVVIAIASVVVRFRRGRMEERQQIKWVLWAGIVALSWTVADLVLFGAGSTEGWRTVGGVIATAIVPLSVALAIIRYRLYDVDRVISKTVTYVAVVAVLGLVFASGAVWIPRAMGLDDSPMLVAVSTLAVAALFNPIRVRVQRTVDRRFNRSRYDAEAVIERFSSQIRDDQNVSELARGLESVIGDTLNPAVVGVWIADDP